MYLNRNFVIVLLLITIFQIYSYRGYGQIEKPQLAFNYIPPSPDVSSLGKYGEIPVDLYTGKPNISIPIFNYSELKENKLDYSITLNYDAGGIKVNDMSSRVGLGWSINLSGVIARTVVG